MTIGAPLETVRLQSADVADQPVVLRHDDDRPVTSRSSRTRRCPARR